ncbi:MAG TPA: hypothetical protein P5284_05630 [Candidatus Contendobacter sp.]|nr:hypothetical protein [Candidatus Contendobacter sp.]HRZ23102.1 hypothetical protein [Candidatus Contendobacter sp.]HRZ52636.1 hypothetical protein [Candidatus Contendobacter sp.]
MAQTYPEFFDPTPLLGDIIDLTSQAQATSIEIMMNNWEGGLDFFASLIKRAEEITTRAMSC